MSAETGKRTNWLAIANDMPTESATGNRMSSEMRNGILGSLGRNPEDYSNPRPMEQLPRGQFSKDETSQYSREQYQARYSTLSDTEKIQFAYMVGGPHGSAGPETTKHLRREADLRDISQIKIPLDDPQAMADMRGFDGVMRNPGLENIEELAKSSEGKLFLLNTIGGLQGNLVKRKNTLEYQMKQADAISADMLIASENFRRLAQDTFGGKAQLGWNLIKDVGYGAANAAVDMTLGTAAWAASGLAMLGPDEQMICNRFPAGPLTPEQQELYEAMKQEVSGIETVSDWLNEANSEMDRLLYRAPSRTGSPVIDDFFSPLASGVGSMLPYFTLSRVPAAVRYAASLGIGYEDAYTQALANDVTKENARTVGFGIAPILAGIECMSWDLIFKAGRTPSFTGEMWRGVGYASIGEASEEAGQSVFSGLATEIGLMLDGKWSYSGDRIKSYLRDAGQGFGFGGILGGGFALGGSRIVRTMALERRRKAYVAVLDGGIKQLSQVTDSKSKPVESAQIIGDILSKNNVGQSGFIDAENFVEFFQGDTVRQQRAMNDYGITQQALDRALEAGAQVEVSTAGALRSGAANPDNATLHEWIRPDPEAPTIRMLLQEQLAEQETQTEYEAIVRENEELPNPFKEYKHQLIGIGADTEYAQYLTDMTYALSRVAGRRMGLSAEQFLNLNPVKVVLERQIAKARAAGTIADGIEDLSFAREATAAQNALERSQQEDPGVREFFPAPDGGTDFAVIGAEKAQAFGLRPIPIRLQQGNAGFGGVHMEKHLQGMQRGGFESIDAFVSYVSNNFKHVIQDGERSILVAMTPDRANALVAELIDEGDYYTVITGWSQKANRNIRGKKPWVQSPPATPDSGDPASLTRPVDESPNQPVGGPGSQGNTISTIPVNRAEVNQWTDEAIGTLVREAGVPKEQTDAFRNYVRVLVDQEADVSNPQALAQDVQTAVTAAEGLDQAIDGLQRILADPGQITQEVFDYLGIDAETVQDGIREIQERMIALQRRATAFREFYSNPDMVRLVQQTSDGLNAPGRRGMVTMTPDVNIIRVFTGKQDRSTILHELMHIYNRHMIQAAQMEGAPEQVRQDYETLNHAVGGGLDSTDPDIRNQAEEHLAAMSERYVFEGEAPTPGLVPAFRRFRAWLTNVYRGVREFAAQELTPEVRGAFDRLIGTDEDIRMARQYYMEAEALALPSGTTPEQAEDLARRTENARLSAEELQVRKVMRHYQETLGGRTEIRNQARRAVKEMPVYQALEAIRSGGSLDRASVEELIGKDGAERIAAHRNVFKKKSKLDDVGMVAIAERFGYESSRDMLADIGNFPGYRVAVNQAAEASNAQIEAEVRAVMETDSATVVDEAYHNDELSNALAAKQAVLDQQARAQAAAQGKRVGRQLSNMAIQRIVADAYGEKSGRKARQYLIEVAAYRKHAEAAARADTAGDKITAAAEFQKMRMAHFGIKESIRARAEVDAFRRENTRVNQWIKRLDGTDRRKPSPVEKGFREAIKDILTTFKVVANARLQPEGTPGPTIVIPGPVDAEITALTPPLVEYIPEWVLARQGAQDIKSWEDLSLGQIRELGETLKILTEQGRGQMRALRQPGIESITQAITESIRRMSQRPERPARYGRGTRNDSRGDRWRNRIDNFLAKGLLPETMMAMADGNTNIQGQGVGPMQYMGQMLSESMNKKSTLFVQDLEKLRPSMKTLRDFSRRFASIDKKRFGDVPEGLKRAYGASLEWDPEMAVMVTLNVGTDNNLNAITNGYGMDAAQIENILSVFTSEELDAVQTVWDTIGAHFKEIDAVHFRLYNRNVVPEQARALTVVLADGTVKQLRGGYFPLLYDGVVDRQIGASQNYEATLNQASYQAVRGAPRVQQGFTIARVGSARPPVLRLDSIYSHLDKVAHFIHLAEAVKESNAITSDWQWSEMYISRFGEAWYNQVRDFIKYVADPDAGNLGQNDLARRAMEWLRHKGTTAALGFNVKSGLKQRLDMAPATLHMSLHSRTGASGVKYMMLGIRDIGFAGNLGFMTDRIQQIYDKSAFMRDTDGNVTADMREILAQARGDGGTVELAGQELSMNMAYNLAYAFMTSQDRAARSGVWAGAYKMAMAGDGDFEVTAAMIEAHGLAEENGTLANAPLEMAAIRFADSAARTFSATTAADLSAWQRDKGMMRLFSTFLSGTVRRTSRLVQYLDAYKQGHFTGVQFVEAFIGDAAIQAWIPAFLAMGIQQLLGDDDDEPITMGGIAMDVFFNPILSVIDGVPMFNAASSAIRYGRGDVLIPSGINQAVRRINQGFSIPKNITKGEWDKAAWKSFAIWGYLQGVPLENAIRDGGKMLKAIGVKTKE